MSSSPTKIASSWMAVGPGALDLVGTSNTEGAPFLRYSAREWDSRKAATVGFFRGYRSECCTVAALHPLPPSIPAKLWGLK
jgi:hypothetical protein